jgi:hypothetical protein
MQKLDLTTLTTVSGGGNSYGGNSYGGGYGGSYGGNKSEQSS